MAINKAGTKKNYEIQVTRVKEFNSGDIFFDCTVNGVKLYGLTYKSGVSEKTGKEYTFVSFPSKKGSDDKYYNHCYFNIDDNTLSDIEKQIESML